MHKAPVWVVTSLAILASATLAAAQGPDRHERGGPAGSAPGGPHGGPAASPPPNRGAGPSVPPAQHREMAPPRVRAPEAPAARTPQRTEERSSRPTEQSRTIERERAVEQRRAAEQQRAKERNPAGERQRATSGNWMSDGHLGLTPARQNTRRCARREPSSRWSSARASAAPCMSTAPESPTCNSHHALAHAFRAT